MKQRTDSARWSGYLSTFHDERPGITEEILAASASDGGNPYEWLLEVIPGDADLLDLACGSAPLLRAGWRGPWTGVDRSRHEVELACRIAGPRVVRAEADHLPFADGRFSAVACSMALMVLQPLSGCLGEASRVLAPGGTLTLLLPGGARPLSAGDLKKWVGLLVALRLPRLSYPNEHLRRRLVPYGSRNGLEVVQDDRRRFAHHIASRRVAERFVDSLYLPGVPDRRRDAAHRTARSWVGTDIGIPLRRLVVRRTD